MFRDVEIPDKVGGPKHPPLRHDWSRVKVGPPFTAPYVYIAKIDESTMLQCIRAGTSHWGWLVIAFDHTHTLVGGYGYAPTLGWAKHRAEQRLAERGFGQSQLWSHDGNRGNDESGLPF